MSDKFKKIDKEFLLTDSTLNCYKFRLLTSGYQADEFKKNPIGYRMHLRDEGVLVKWEDFRIDGDEVFAKPVINLNHPKGAQSVDEVENGFLNAASVGNIVALEISTNPADYLPDQTGPTVTKWFNREASLVDIPGNYNALTKLVDKDNNPINLADFTINKNLNMEQIFFTPANIAAMNLSATASKADVEAAFANLVDKAGKHDKAVKDLADFKTAAADKEVDDLIAAGITDKKFNAAAGKVLKTQFAGNPTGLKSLVDTMPKYASITGAINANGEATATELQNLMAKDYNTLDKEGKIPRLRELNEDAFQAKYKEKFGKAYDKK